MTPEFSRRYPLDTIGSEVRTLTITASTAECALLAQRFGLIALDALSATATLAAVADGIVESRGIVRAGAVQACVVTGDPVSAVIEEPFALRFRDPEPTTDSEEVIDPTEADCDLALIDNGAVDLGEAVAQTLCLALDPFPRSAGVRNDQERVWQVGDAAHAFAGLKDLLVSKPSARGS